MISIRTLARATRSPAARMSVRSLASASDSATFQARKPFDLHRLESGPSTTFTATKEECLHYLRQMLTIRRMEITCDQEYKMRNIRGFCHLSDGQEAVAVGVQGGLTLQDDWVTSYRCHGVAYLRGSSVANVLGELFGFAIGTVGGKGGSMHFYGSKHGFWGGHGIVGAQVPVGNGIAFAHAYNAKEGQPMNVSVAACGDGAVNQGQVWESINMAALWKLPMIFMVENNMYGMGTSSARSSSNPEYYTHGNHVPGLRVDGMDVLAVREATRFAKEYCGGGHGPLVMEVRTYRYHGHSMSDPGMSYRDREEINMMREKNDCIELLKGRMIESGLATADELKEVEKDVRKEVADQLALAKTSGPPADSELYTHVTHYPLETIRGVELSNSYHRK